MSLASRLQIAAPAKINLSLRVRGKTSDGYHALESLVGFADIGDRLSLKSSAASSRLTLRGTFAGLLQEMDARDAKDNLILRAVAALEKASGRALGSELVLEKNLPIAAGLGGGSADAAAALRALIELHRLEISDTHLAEIALSLGADVPVCLASAPSWMTGIGETLAYLPNFPATEIVLVNPHVAMPTAAVFSALHASPNLRPAQPVPEAWQDLDGLVAFLTQQGNDLQGAAISLAPEIGDCLSALQQAGAKYAAMSGSGASCFALCEIGEGAKVAAAYQAARAKDWVQAGRLIGAGDTKINQA